VPPERDSLGDLLRRQPLRILVAGGITALGIIVLALVALLGGNDDPSQAGPADDTVPVEELPPAAPEEPPVTEPPPTMVVRSDWYRKGSSVYAQRQSAQTIPAGPGTTTSTPAPR
jgi:hypothetical protein